VSSGESRNESQPPAILSLRCWSERLRLRPHRETLADLASLRRITRPAGRSLGRGFDHGEQGSACLSLRRTPNSCGCRLGSRHRDAAFRSSSSECLALLGSRGRGFGVGSSYAVRAPVRVARRRDGPNTAENNGFGLTPRRSRLAAGLRGPGIAGAITGQALWRGTSGSVAEDGGTGTGTVCQMSRQ